MERTNKSNGSEAAFFKQNLQSLVKAFFEVPLKGNDHLNRYRIPIEETISTNTNKTIKEKDREIFVGSINQILDRIQDLSLMGNHGMNYD
jgi:hypothetical protein